VRWLSTPTGSSAFEKAAVQREANGRRARRVGQRERA
jgi:hypothetical protein